MDEKSLVKIKMINDVSNRCDPCKCLKYRSKEKASIICKVRVGKKIGASSVSRYKLIKGMTYLFCCYFVNSSGASRQFCAFGRSQARRPLKVNYVEKSDCQDKLVLCWDASA